MRNSLCVIHRALHCLVWLGVCLLPCVTRYWFTRRVHFGFTLCSLFMFFDCHVLPHRRTLSFLHARQSFHRLSNDSLEFRCLSELFIGSLCLLCHYLSRVTAHVLRVAGPSLGPPRRAVFRASPPGAGIPKIVRKWRQSRVPRRPPARGQGGGGHTLPSSPKHPLLDTAWGGGGRLTHLAVAHLRSQARRRTHAHIHTYTRTHVHTHVHTVTSPAHRLCCAAHTAAGRLGGGAGRGGTG